MKTVAKIVWKNEPSYFWCGGSAPEERNTLTLTPSDIWYRSSAKMNDYMGDECPVSRASESWKAKIKHPDYQESFKNISMAADQIVNEQETLDVVYDGPIQSLIVYYDDGSEVKVTDKCAFLLDVEFLKDKLSRFLPDRMSRAIFGEN